MTGLYPILDVDLATSRGWAPLVLFSVWLDAGELTQIVGKEDQGEGWFGKLFG